MVKKVMAHSTEATRGTGGTARTPGQANSPLLDALPVAFLPSVRSFSPALLFRGPSAVSARLADPLTRCCVDQPNASCGLRTAHRRTPISGLCSLSLRPFTCLVLHDALFSGPCCPRWCRLRLGVRRREALSARSPRCRFFGCRIQDCRGRQERRRCCYGTVSHRRGQQCADHERG